MIDLWAWVRNYMPKGSTIPPFGLVFFFGRCFLGGVRAFFFGAAGAKGSAKDGFFVVLLGAVGLPFLLVEGPVATGFFMAGAVFLT